jgi:hypothetical protein
MHGSFLPKNPKVADWLVQQAMRKAGNVVGLSELDDELENEARKIAAKRSQ